MGDPNSVSVKRMALSAKLTGGLVFFSVLLMACVLAISIVTLVRVYQIEKTQEADSKRANNPLNIPSPATANPENPEKYKAYSNFASRLRNSMDLSKNPCDNFYEYSCGNFKGNMSFTEIQVNNLITVIQQFQKKSYMNDPKLPVPVKQAGELFAKCVEAKGKWAQEVGKGERLTEKMKKLEDLLGVHFPLLNPNSDQVHYPDARIFSSALAHLNNQENLPTFVTTTIETNWQDPHSAQQPYILAFDQATLSLQEAYYTRIWEQIKNHLLENMIQMLTSYAEFKGVKLEKAKIEADAKAMLEMEYQIGANLNTREDIRRNYKRMYNVQKARQADGISKFLNFEELVRNSVPSGMGAARVENFLVKEPQAMTKIMEYIFTPDKVQPRTLFNYLFYRLLSANIEYLPKKGELTKLPEATNFRLGLPRRPRRIPMPAFNPPTDLDLKRMLSPELMDMGMCALENAQLLPWANGRVFLDAKFPGQEERQKLRKDIRLMIAAVLDAFRSMLSQLEWMSGMTKTAAYSKIDNLVTNAAWPDLVDNDEKLAKYYGELEWKEGMSYTQMVDLLQNYQQHIFFKELFTAKNTDRSDFSMSPSIVNAWYQPELNSITFPLGILEPPFYDPNFPASVNFGGIGLIAGHELTHGFDDQGIQWDGTGVLKSWMDPNSEKGFDNMAQCVVDEYGRFEPVKGLTIDGKMTQGENIADNGGLRASFKAYRTHVGLNGPDPRLPDEQLKMFSHDQLFFLSFAQGWCQREGERDLKKQLLIDPHSPSKYRILGSIQNFPAFRAAFNCPIGTVYGPVKNCEVWETESKMTN